LRSPANGSAGATFENIAVCRRNELKPVKERKPDKHGTPRKEIKSREGLSLPY
jgi:hypothetical protein